ncbi:MAG TPA: SMI1/KNR4 family protein, partial [Vicinamibacteria bacterium]|nr:SMI1/KNR4 family protein [Vicinamibacteria bacterium]
MTGLETLLHRFESGRREAHMTSPASDEELQRIDEALGRPLPEPLRALLHEVGGGLYEGGHEVFGPTR